MSVRAGRTSRTLLTIRLAIVRTNWSIDFRRGAEGRYGSCEIVVECEGWWCLVLWIEDLVRQTSPGCSRGHGHG